MAVEWPWCLPEAPEPIDWQVWADKLEEEGDLPLSAAIRFLPEWQCDVLASIPPFRERLAEPCELRMNNRNWWWNRWFPHAGHPRPRGAVGRDGQPDYCYPHPFDPKDLLGASLRRHGLGEILRRPIRAWLAPRMAKIVGLDYGDGLGPFLDDQWVLLDLTMDRNRFFERGKWRGKQR